MSTPARMTMLQAAAAQRSFSLRLYRALLRSHRAMLPSVMRDLGDAYVREEFKRHKSAQPDHLNAFFREWLRYLSHMNTQGQGGYGADLDEEWTRSLSAEQRGQLQQLKIETQRAAEYAAKRAQEDTERLLRQGEDVATSPLPLGMQAIDAREKAEQDSRGRLPSSTGGASR